MSMRSFLVQISRPGSRVDSMYSLPLSGIGEHELEDEKKRLTLQAKANFGPPSPPFKVYKVEEGRLYVPRFYGMQRFGPPEEDVRVEGEDVRIPFEVELREVQAKAMASLFSSHFSPSGVGGGIVVLPCGFGKTILAIAVSARLGKKTAVLVHTSVLKAQWKESFEKFSPGIRVGYVQGSTFDVEGKDVVIFMVQTLAKRQFPFEMTDSFGFVVCDEAHHLAAPIMSQALLCFRAKKVMALTATKERTDGLTRLLHWSLGEEAFRAERKSDGARVTLVKFKGTSVEKVRKDGRPLVAVMLNLLSSDIERNRFLAKRTAEMRRNGRSIIFLSHRCAQLKTVRSLLVSEPLSLPEEDVGLLESSQNEEQRRVQIDRPVLLCSYNMADEGLDKATLDTLIMATPKSRIEQCTGRILRQCETKQYPLVLDVLDEGFYFGRLKEARMNFYRKSNYEVQFVDHDEERGRWFQ